MPEPPLSFADGGVVAARPWTAIWMSCANSRATASRCWGRSSSGGTRANRNWVAEGEVQFYFRVLHRGFEAESSLGSGRIMNANKPCWCGAERFTTPETKASTRPDSRCAGKDCRDSKRRLFTELRTAIASESEADPADCTGTGRGGCAGFVWLHCGAEELLPAAICYFGKQRFELCQGFGSSVKRASWRLSRAVIR